MYKENGRKEPADKIELASLKGKFMECSKCQHVVKLKNVTFGSTICSECGSNMVESGVEAAGKITG